MPQSHECEAEERTRTFPITVVPMSFSPTDDHLPQAQRLRLRVNGYANSEEDLREITLHALLPLPGWASSTARQIANLPQTRNSTLRAGRTTPRMTTPATSQIRSNYEACLADQRGMPPPLQCKHCSHPSRPGGPFTKCVVLAGFFGGACTNCKVNNTASRCSLYTRMLYSSKLSRVLTNQ